MRATELKLARRDHTWVELNGANWAQQAFEQALHEALLSAAYDTRVRNAEELLVFIENFLVQFSQACPNWKNVLPEITDYLQNTGTKNRPLLNYAIERVQSEQPLRLEHGVLNRINRFGADGF
ncbi:hypothetical protein [Ruegeria arenilitoris]|uniref:hypothetical protein n=1 Tax=Ruegeria arenilitoris TaxID=1173585 RepID=UPI00147BB888|nr:hypothetical protein [Ruegeria arenilitoris]